MEEIYLTGVYPNGEGAIVQVQRLENGEWEDFPVDAVVSGETFSTYVQTAQTGVNRFRVRDTDSDQVSNEVRVKIRQMGRSAWGSSCAGRSATIVAGGAGDLWQAD